MLSALPFFLRKTVIFNVRRSGDLIMLRNATIRVFIALNDLRKLSNMHFSKRKTGHFKLRMRRELNVDHAPVARSPSLESTLRGPSWDQP